MPSARRATGRARCSPPTARADAPRAPRSPRPGTSFTGVYGRPLIRPATEYEVQILCREIEASLRAGGRTSSPTAIAEHEATVEARRRDEELAAQEALAPPRKRRLRITGGESLDLNEAIDEHKETARTRRSREAEQVGLDWLFEEVLVLPEDFDDAPAADDEFDFDAAEAELTAVRRCGQQRPATGPLEDDLRDDAAGAQRQQHPHRGDEVRRLDHRLGRQPLLHEVGHRRVHERRAQSAVDLIPSAPSSAFIACVKPTTPNFVAE